MRLGLPGDLLARLEDVAQREGSTPERVAVRLLARELPEVLAEAARAAFGPYENLRTTDRPPWTDPLPEPTNPPALPPGTAP